MFLWVAKVEESSRGVQPRAASSSSSSSIEWLFRVMLHRCGEGTASERSRRDSSSRIVRARVSRRFSSNATLTFSHPRRQPRRRLWRQPRDRREPCSNRDTAGPGDLRGGWFDRRSVPPCRASATPRAAIYQPLTPRTRRRRFVGLNLRNNCTLSLIHISEPTRPY